MNLGKQKKQNDPTQEEIKFILKLLHSNNFADARKEVEKKITNFPNSSILFNILGAIFAGKNELKKAIENYNRAITLNPNYAQAYNNLGITLYKLKKIGSAIDNYKKALNLKSDFAEALNNLGSALRDFNKPKDAIQYFEKAIKINSNYAEAYFNLALTHESIGEKEKALECFQTAIKINKNYFEAYNGLGLSYSSLAKFEESELSYRKAIKINPNYDKAYNNLGNLFSDIGKYDEATLNYNKAIKINPRNASAYSNLLFNLNYKLDFDLNLYLSMAKKFSQNCRMDDKEFNISYSYEKKPKKLRLGLVSADFGNHPGGFFTLSTLRELIKRDIELVAYSTSDRDDSLSHFFKPLFIKWNSIEKKDDKEVVEQICKDGIHILIDLQGHSAKNRLPIFFYKSAPIQASWLAQGSLGIKEVDYFIGSPHITPKDEEKYYYEKILRLPEISQCFTKPTLDLKISELPALKNKFITFGSNNKLTKINDDVILLWSKVLSSIPNSKLILKNKNLENKKIANIFISKFEKNNINKNRLILKGESYSREETLKIYNKIDIGLDPFPFQGNTTTCEAVWMGVPVLTLKGNRYLFHFGESINSNLNMEDWIAENEEEYISKAVKFSTNIKHLSEIRNNLRQTALNSPVFDSLRFSDHLSSMLWRIWDEFENKK